MFFNDNNVRQRVKRQPDDRPFCSFYRILPPNYMAPHCETASFWQFFHQLASYRTIIIAAKLGVSVAWTRDELSTPRYPLRVAELYMRRKFDERGDVMRVNRPSARPAQRRSALPEQSNQIL